MLPLVESWLQVHTHQYIPLPVILIMRPDRLTGKVGGITFIHGEASDISMYNFPNLLNSEVMVVKFSILLQCIITLVIWYCHLGYDKTFIPSLFKFS